MSAPRLKVVTPAQPVQGSTKKIFQTLLVNNYEKKVSKDIISIPTTNTVFKSVVSLYIRQTISTADSVAPSVQRLLEFSGAIASRLPKSDANKALLARQEELFTNEYGAYTAELKALQDEINQAHINIDHAITNILRILAPNPTAQEGSQPLRSQIRNAEAELTRIRTKSEVTFAHGTELQTKAVTHFKAVSSMSGTPATRAEVTAVQAGEARPSSR